MEDVYKRQLHHRLNSGKNRPLPGAARPNTISASAPAARPRPALPKADRRETIPLVPKTLSIAEYHSYSIATKHGTVQPPHAENSKMSHCFQSIRDILK